MSSPDAIVCVRLPVSPSRSRRALLLLDDDGASAFAVCSRLCVLFSAASASTPFSGAEMPSSAAMSSLSVPAICATIEAALLVLLLLLSVVVRFAAVPFALWRLRSASWPFDGPWCVRLCVRLLASWYVYVDAWWS